MKFKIILENVVCLNSKTVSFLFFILTKDKICILYENWIPITMKQVGLYALSGWRKKMFNQKCNDNKLSFPFFIKENFKLGV